MSDDIKLLEDLYTNHKEAFLNTYGRYGLDREELIDIFQDSVISLYEQVMSGKTHIRTTYKQYLHGIAKYKMNDRIKSKIKDREHLSDEAPLIEVPEGYLDPDDAQTEVIRRHLSAMGVQCQKILRLFYYQRYSIEAIMHEMKFKNENVTKSYKSRCLKKLKELVHHG